MNITIPICISASTNIGAVNKAGKRINIKKTRDSFSRDVEIWSNLMKFIYLHSCILGQNARKEPPI